jgi:hypothetical protein
MVVPLAGISLLLPPMTARGISDKEQRVFVWYRLIADTCALTVTAVSVMTRQFGLKKRILLAI